MLDISTPFRSRSSSHSHTHLLELGRNLCIGLSRVPQGFVFSGYMTNIAQDTHNRNQVQLLIRTLYSMIAHVQLTQFLHKQLIISRPLLWGGPNRSSGAHITDL